MIGHPSYVTDLFVIHNSHANTPLQSKLLQYRSPIEAYQRKVIESADFAGWDNPISNFARPYTYGLLANTTPVGGAMSGGMGGFLFGGPIGSAIGMAVGGLYGTIHGGFRAATNTTYIPGRIQDEREQSEYWDKMKYVKARRLFEQTGDKQYNDLMAETMMGVDPYSDGKEIFKNMYRAAPATEQPFIHAFLDETDLNNRAEILKIVPRGIGGILKKRWEKGDHKVATARQQKEISSELTTYFSDHHMPGGDWAGWDSAIDLGDIQMKTMRREGLDAHRAGFGYFDQEERVLNSPFIPGPIDIHSKNDEPQRFQAYDKSMVSRAVNDRSEERRVGKECRSRWSPYH